MKKNRIAWLLILLLGIMASCSEQRNERPSTYVIVVHGGAGNIVPGSISEEKAEAIHAAMKDALTAGQRVLSAGGSSLDAVEAAIVVMEDSPLFNAGRGAVLTEKGTIELDASIMDGKTQNAGAVAGVSTVKNPVRAARNVMERSVHVMMTGKGAEEFAMLSGLELVDSAWFYTEEKRSIWQEQIQKMKGDVVEKHGTVGAVALDVHGNLAAGTSTGGMMMKKFGRVGDSPVIGAGTWASNKTCAVSATGHGEYFIRNVVAYDISARMEYLGESLEKASGYVINEKLRELGANGGVIAIDGYGNIAMPFNTGGMYRGYLKEGGQPVTMMFDED